MRLLLLLPLVAIPTSVRTVDEPLRVEGEYVLTVTALPVTVHAPDVEGLTFKSWHYPTDATVEIRNDNRELLIRALPAGDSLIWGDFGQVINGEAQPQFTRRVVLRNGLAPRPPPEPEPPEPDEVPPDEFDNVGRLAFQVSDGLAGADTVATNYRNAAKGIRDGTYVTAREGIEAIEYPAGWDTASATLSEALGQQWPLDKTRAADWCDAVAVGLEARAE